MLSSLVYLVFNDFYRFSADVFMLESTFSFQWFLKNFFISFFNLSVAEILLVFQICSERSIYCIIGDLSLWV